MTDKRKKIDILNNKDFLNNVKMIFDNVPICTIIVNYENKVVYLNPSYEKFLNVNIETSRGNPVQDIIPKSRLPLVTKNKRSLLGKWHTFDDLNGQKALVHLMPLILDDDCLGAIGLILFHDNMELKALGSELLALQTELDYFKKELKNTQNTHYAIDDILGESKAVKDLKNRILSYTSMNNNKATVLITGESGSGKELVAQSFHDLSPNRNGPFVRVNCSSIPETLFESELFGYESGSFTGAKKGGYKGKFEQANGGTLFLDEIGELTLTMQPKLLRAIQEKEITPIGSNKIIPVDVRIIAATNRNLREMVANKTFRDDLYYRLDVLHIDVPSLRKRGSGDIKLLLNYFLEKNIKDYGEKKEFAEEMYELLCNYSWPGNIRELENLVEKAYMNEPSEIIKIRSLPMPLILEIQQSIKNKEVITGFFSLPEEIEKLEDNAVKSMMKFTNNNIAATAKALGISRSRLYRILNRD